MKIPARLRLSSALLGAAFVVHTVIAQAAPPTGPTTLAQRFAAVAEWRGEFVAGETGSFSHSGQTTPIDEGTVAIHTRGRFTLRRSPGGQWDPARGVFEWTGDGDAQATHHATRDRREWSGDETSVTIEGAGGVPLRQVRIKISLADKYSSLHWGMGETPLTKVQTGHALVGRYDAAAGTTVFDRVSMDETTPHSMGALYPVLQRRKGQTVSELDWYPQVAGGPGVISVSADLPVDGLRHISTLSGEQSRHQATVLLYPVYADLELVVRLEGTQLTGKKATYAEWLPEGVGIPFEDPKVGSWLQLAARLQERDGRPAPVEIKQVRFELHNTSHESGVAMNWPAIGLPGDHTGPIPPDPRPDLRFDGKFGSVEEARGLQTQRVRPGKDSDGAPSATTRVESFDYGGWSELVVVAELTDGREVIGHLDGEPDTTLILLPKRSNGSLVADAWRKKEKATAADSDDSEKTAVSEPGCNGDGLTLYEEYRGFMAGGRHVRTSPKKKDLMLYNACGGVAAPGIALFQRLTGLRVHAQLLEDERNYPMPEEPRFGFPTNKNTVINGNHDLGPHRVNQHRLDLLVCGDTKSHGGGTRTVSRDWDRRARPFAVENLFVERPDADFWREQYGVRTADQPRQFDTALAHELLHAVGGEHHGEGAYPIRVKALPVGHSDNPTQEPAWIMYYLGRRYYFRFLDERTGEDITARWVAAANRIVVLGDTVARDEPALGFHTKNGVGGGVQDLYVGKRADEHSGDETCVMRYWLADAYEKQGASDNTLYMVPDGTEPVGTQLCDATQGRDKNVNLAGRSPQPRYFDAAPGRGRCRFWVCGNDAIAPAPAAIKKPMEIKK